MCTALILVDLQKDFLPGGALPVPGGDQVIPVANRLLERFRIVALSRDYHPHDHLSFASQHPGKAPGDIIEVLGRPQRLWPDHCVKVTPGAAFSTALRIPVKAKVFDKGVHRDVDGYSAFRDCARLRDTGLHEYLQQQDVSGVVIAGLALDVCVKATALDALGLGYETTVVTDGTRAVGVERDASGGSGTWLALRDAGARIWESKAALTA